MAEGCTAHPRDQRHKALESVLEALDMEHVRIPSTKANPIQTEAFYAEILAVLAERVEGSEKSIDALAEAVTVLLNRKVEADEAKADDIE